MEAQRMATTGLEAESTGRPVRRTMEFESATDEELERDLDATALVIRAHELCDAGAYAEAEGVTRRALARSPGFATARVALGRALVGLGRFDEAQAVLIETSYAYPGYAAAYRWLAEAFIKSGDEARGRAYLADAVRLSPSDPALDDLIIRETGDVMLPGPRPQTDFEPTVPRDLSVQAQLLARDWWRDQAPGKPESPREGRPEAVRTPTPTPARRRPMPDRSRWRTVLVIVGAAALGAAGASVTTAWRRGTLRQAPRLPQRREAVSVRPAVRVLAAARVATAAPAAASGRPDPRVGKTPPTAAGEPRRRGASRG